MNEREGSLKTPFVALIALALAGVLLFLLHKTENLLTVNSLIWISAVLVLLLLLFPVIIKLYFFIKKKGKAEPGEYKLEEVKGKG